MSEDKSASKMRGLLTRALTAAVLIPIAVGVVVWGGRAYSALIAFMVIILIFEWARIVDRAEFSRGFYTLSFTAIAAVFFAAGGQYWLAIGLALGGGGLATILELRKKPAVSWPLVGAVYLVLPAIAVLFIRHIPETGLGLTLVLFGVVWATDSGAYLFGTFIGGPKLWEKLSPGKTWSGAIGGLFCGAAAAMVIGLMSGLLLTPQRLMLTGFALALATIAGDLLESALKRAYGVKDTGGAFPGHGGVLDRLDGFILAATALALLLVARGQGIA
ncbi:phosphatidate cytidylyltransferase [Parvularcula marina]|uniref:phosphatidate cytidylyltransferase n=1 Tax=Parvularcula marina TaxID=2292771 RepID=UPI0035175174